MNFAEMNGEQLQARMDELIAETSEEKRDALDNDALEARINEIEAIQKELEARKAAAAEEARQCEEAAEQSGKPIIEEERKMNYEVNSPEFREAFLKNLQGKELTAEERTAVTASAAIPTQTMNQIVHTLELNPLIAAVDFTQIPGNVTYPAENSINEASWVAMGDASTDSADTLQAVNLYAYKLIKTVEIGADVEAMSVDAFESWLVARLANKIEKALDSAILNGGGADSSMATGIKVTKSAQDGTFTRAGITWKQLTEIMGKLAPQYHANASFVMSPTLFFGKVLGMVDSQNNRVVVNDPQEPRKYNILGFPAIIDGNAGTEELYFGDLKAYKLNLAKGVEVRKSEEAAFRTGSAVYRAMCLADGKLADSSAIVRYIATT